MEKDAGVSDKVEKLKELKLLLNETENKLSLLARELDWDYKKLLEETSAMVTCTINPQHRMPASSLKAHEQKCAWQSKGYTTCDKTFPEYSGSGSYITLTPEILHSITQNVSSSTVFLYLVFLIIMTEFKTNHILLLTSANYDVFIRFRLSKFCSESKPLRDVPESSAKFDQNFNREEKLAIYDYVVANTQKQESYPDLWLIPTEKSEEKREKAAWEIAAAERDAKRRRASYRNKVHTNRKTHTEILREVIEAQMETFKEDPPDEKTADLSRPHTITKKSSHESSDKKRHHESSSRRYEEDQNKRRNHDKHSKHREHRRSPSDAGSDTKSRSRFHGKHRKWKSYEGRSHSHRSSHTHRR